jgi:hypothetical protein
MELRQISQRFRDAYLNSTSSSQGKRESELRQASQEAVEVLRVLALSIRSEQDHDLTTNVSKPVGAVNRDVTDREKIATINDYEPPYENMTGFEPLGLRKALNKIAHADPTRNGFHADKSTHDLILTGSYRNKGWTAIISITDLCDAIRSIPDMATQNR